MQQSILITGANRGIGLELVKQYAENDWQVYACCRSPDQATELKQLADQYSQISIHPLDVSNNADIHALAKALDGQSIDILLNNAGIYGPYDAHVGNTDEQQWIDCFRINSIAPMKVTEAFLPHVSASQTKLIATMSSKMGSMADNGSGGSYLYRSSKAAVNAVMKSLSIDLKAKGIKVAILHPGWVKTDMGGPNAEITTQECVKHLRRNLDNVTLDNTGTFFEIDGSVIPW
jgi:NAD(P)-dependent dehydrogenase (short-subunit alcohol dehydrogenase family)